MPAWGYVHMRETIAEKNEIKIDLRKLLMVYLKKWWLILLCVILAAGAMLVYTQNFVVPMYRASVTVYVNNSSAGERIEYISGSNLSASQQLVNTYINIIKSDTVLEKVVEQSGLNYSADQLRDILSASQVGGTEMFNIYILHPDPEMAARIANAVANVAPGEIEQIVEGSSTKIIDYAKVPDKPYSPDYRKNLVMGGAVGCLIALAYLTLTYLLDVRIKEEDDLTALFEFPVLGQIPDIASVSSSSKKKYGYETEPSSVVKGGK